jgi:hypothetical protein
LLEASGACFLEMFMVCPQRKFHMISINISLLAAIKLEDKCGFHFSILLLTEGRIIFKDLEFKKIQATCVIIIIIIIIITTGHYK